MRRATRSASCSTPMRARPQAAGSRCKSVPQGRSSTRTCSAEDEPFSSSARKPSRRAGSAPKPATAAALSALAATVIAVDWLRLEQPRHTGSRILGLVLLAIAPALVRGRRPRTIAVVVAAFGAAALAFSLSFARILPGGRPFFAPLWSRFTGGIEEFYTYHLPI